MTGRDVLAWCRGRADVTEERPFGPDTLVFKRAGRMFLATPAVADPDRMTAKADPGLAETLREQYPAIQAGYHVNKRHWNTVALDGTVPDAVLRQLVDDAYRLVGPPVKRAVSACR